MTIYYPDIASFQAGISTKNALVVVTKATEDTTYLNPDYARAKANAASTGSFFVAYHFLHEGNAAAQAAYAFSKVGKTPLMLDVESTGTSIPKLGDITGFVDAYRKLGGIVYLTYLPKWYWQEIGSPSLAPLVTRSLALVSSSYTTYTDASSGAGWQPYGGITPAVWQFTDALSFNGFSVDFNAFRGSYAGKQDAASVAATVAEFKSLVTTGRLNPVPTPTPWPTPTGLVAGEAPRPVRLSWTPVPGCETYEYEIESGGVTIDGATNVNGTSVTVSLPSGSYRFRVVAHVSATHNWSAWSAWSDIFTVS